jgi:hypothetical protein
LRRPKGYCVMVRELSEQGGKSNGSRLDSKQGGSNRKDERNPQEGEDEGRHWTTHDSISC